MDGGRASRALDHRASTTNAWHRPWLRRVAALQAGVYATTGAWPLVHFRSFELVTGRKRENWLVKANGAIFLGIGMGLGMAALRDRLTPDWRALAVTLGTGVVAVEVANLRRRRIAPVFWLDAAFEAFLVVAWLALGRGPREGATGA
jgi:hypothetical protein